MDEVEARLAWAEMSDASCARPDMNDDYAVAWFDALSTGPKRGRGTSRTSPPATAARHVRRGNRVDGRKGFPQYQFIVSFGAVDTLRRIVRRRAESGDVSYPRPDVWRKIRASVDAERIFRSDLSLRLAL